MNENLPPQTEIVQSSHIPTNGNQDFKTCEYREQYRNIKFEEMLQQLEIKRTLPNGSKGIFYVSQNQEIRFFINENLKHERSQLISRKQTEQGKKVDLCLKVVSPNLSITKENIPEVIAFLKKCRICLAPNGLRLEPKLLGGVETNVS